MPVKRQSKVYYESDSDDDDDEFKELATLRKPISNRDNPLSLQFEIPASVQSVIHKIEESHIFRAKEVSSQSIDGLCTALYNFVQPGEIFCCCCLNRKHFTLNS